MILRTLALSSAVVALAQVHAQTTFMRTLELPVPVAIAASTVGANGNIYLCGRADTIDLAYKGIVLCMDPVGNVLWSRTFGGNGPDFNISNGQDYPGIAFGDIAYAAGSISVVGFASYLWNGSYYGAQLSLTLDTLGNTLYAVSESAIHRHGPKLVKARGTNEVIRGHYLNGLLGQSVGFSIGSPSPPSITASSATYAFGDGLTFGNDVDDFIDCADGGVLAVCDCRLLVKMNALLEEEWHITFTNPGLYATEGHLAETPDGAFVLVGHDGSEQVIVSRYSSTGTLDWSYILDLQTETEVTGVSVRDNGKILVAGGALPGDSSYLWLAQLDQNGTWEWTQRYGDLGGVVEPIGFDPSPDGHAYIMTGRLDEYNAVILRVDTLGQMAGCAIPGITPVQSVSVPDTTVDCGPYLSSPQIGYDWIPEPIGSYALDATVCIGANMSFRATGSNYFDADQDGVYDSGEAAFPWTVVNVSPNTGSLFTDGDGTYNLVTNTPGTHVITAPPPAPWWALSSDSASYHPTFTAVDTLFEDLDFGFSAAYDTTLLIGSLTCSPTRCFGPATQMIAVANQGSTMPQGVVALTLDPLIALDSATPPPDSIVGAVAYWHFGPLGFYQNWNAELHVSVPDGLFHIGDTLHSTMNVFADDGLGGLSLVHSDPWEGVVVCSYDPNDKLVAAVEMGENGTIPVGTEWLTYTIRFQNTGTDTAFTVVIEDLLSQYLQWNTLQYLSSSHDLSSVGISAYGKASFRFENILLPDSNVNEPASHGFVKFRIALQPGLPYLTAIENNAGIFFDLNAPVITNTTHNTIIDCGAVTWTVGIDMGGTQLYAFPLNNWGVGTFTYAWYLNGALIPGATEDVYMQTANGDYYVVVTDQYGCSQTSTIVTVGPMGIADAPSTVFMVRPNPFSEATILFCTQAFDRDVRIEIVDVHGRVVRIRQGNGTRAVMIERGALQSGLYMLRVMDGNGQRGSVRVVVE